MLRKKSSFAAQIITASTVLVSAAAIAGTAVYGYGSTRADAIRDANAQAESASMARFGKRTCITRATHSTCSKDSEGWVCTAYVANHAGSCR
ncbi:hypothetical protein LY632_05000 [Erythrobacter sp. SDW2]|uniref:hypothetical protein n=1 Tax=Erythrobacter sp. SDW2 TaxID=2907154 RepID=UPI001F425BC1|nr:hypothetical protein [Erythrobacter sp. SDW2]UIP07759.1 hypothetical protein LY632_05000 [Erythrobacter sp. SDW2]